MGLQISGKSDDKSSPTEVRSSFIKKHPGLTLCLLISLFVSAMYLNNFNLFTGYEHKALSLMFKLRGTEDTSGEVVLLTIDDKSVGYLGDWPWNHQRLAQLVEALTYYEPKTVSLLFPIEQNVDDYVAGNSQLLAENILQADNILLPFYPMISRRTPRTSTAPQWLDRSSLISVLPFDAENVPRAERLELPSDQFGVSSRLSGAIINDFDDDNSLRTQPMILMYEQNFYPSIEVATAAMASNIPMDQVYFSQEEKLLRIGPKSIPVDDEGNYLINYYGPPGSIPTYSVKDFWDGELEVKQLKGKTVIVSTTASGLADKIISPFTNDLTPGEKTATVIDNIFSQEFITPINSSVDIQLLLVVAIGLLCAVFLPRISVIYRFTVLFFLAVGLVAFSVLMFESKSTFASFVFPFFEVVLLTLVSPLLGITLKPETETPAIKKESDSADEIEKQTKAPQDKDNGSTAIEIDEAKTKPPKADNSRRTPPPQETVAEVFSSKEAETVLLAQMEQGPIEPERSKVDDSVVASDDGTKQKSVSDKIPTSFGRYRVIDTVGRGAMGTVYKGEDPAIGRAVALKTIRVDKIADASEVDELRERLNREAKAAGSLSHPNIVTIYDVGQDGDTQYIAMEYLEGYTLEQIIGRDLELNFKIAAKIVYQVCSALSYAHKHNIVHRDIKPANIMVLDGFHVKVMDFGIAHFESSSLTQTGIAMGTPNYISPEQLKGEEVTLSSDIFSLGVVFFELLTGKKPFVGENISNLIMKIINDQPPAPSSYNPKMPPILDIVVKKALEKNPYERYGNADEMMRALEDFALSFQAKKVNF